MNKIITVSLGLVGGLVCVMYVSELFKILAAHLLISGSVSISFEGLKLNVVLPPVNDNNFYTLAAVTVVPFAACVLFIEASFLWLKKTVSVKLKSSIMIFQLINIGYLILAAFMGIISIVLPFSFATDWTRFLNQGNLSYNQKLVFILLILVILLTYVNVLTKRIRKYVMPAHR